MSAGPYSLMLNMWLPCRAEGLRPPHAVAADLTQAAWTNLGRERGGVVDKGPGQVSGVHMVRLLPTLNGAEKH